GHPPHQRNTSRSSQWFSLTALQSFSWKLAIDALNVGDNRACRLRPTGNRRRKGGVLCDRLEATTLVAEVIEVWIGNLVVSTIRLDFEDGCNPARIGVGQRLQQNAVHNGEDGRCGSDAERQSQRSDRGESRVLAQLSQCVM